MRDPADVEVEPHSRRPIPAAAVRALLDSLGPVETVSLFCDRDLLEHDTRLGFRHHPEQVVLHRPGGFS